MKKYFGWMLALVASMTMTAAYANEVSEVAEEESAEETVAVIVEDDAGLVDIQVEE